MANGKGSNKTPHTAPHKKKIRFHLTDSGKRLFSAILMVLFACIFVFSAIKLIDMIKKYRAGRAVYADIASETVEYVPSPDPNDTIGQDGEEEPVFEEVTVSEPAQQDEISGSLPWAKEERVASVTGLSIKWEQLRRKNPDVAAWLYMPDSNINYPIMLADNNEYYLDHNFNRKEDESGALFFDYRSDLNGTYENWIIYGHRRNDRSMFGSIAKYAKESYLKEHPYMFLLLPDRAYKVEIFSCRTVHALPRFFLTTFDSDDELQYYIETAINGSYWESPVDVTADAPILTLATCSTYVRDDDPRLLVHGKLIPIE